MGYYANKLAAMLIGAWTLQAMLVEIVYATPPGVVIAFSDPASQIYLGNPSFAVLPNGDYVVSHDAWGPGHPYSQTYLFRSQDQGATWISLATLPGQYESSLFLHDGSLYILGGGTDSGNGFVSIRKSTDNGKTWTTPTNSLTGRLVTGGKFNAGATQIIEHNGRVWRAMERVDPSMPTGGSTEFRSFVLSAPAGSDLINAANWRVSNSLLMDDYISGSGWLEGGIVVTPRGLPATFLRTSNLGEKAAIIDILANGSTTSFQPATGLVDFPSGGSSKFTVRYDDVTGRYWSLTNNRDNPGDVRNVLELVSSPNLIDWTKEGTILSHPDPVHVGFQYADWRFDGNDIVFVSRTAYDSAPNFHDTNYITFHRIMNFRSFAFDATTTINSTNDGMIDQHLNFNVDPLGSADSFSHSHGPGPARDHIVVGRLADDYQNPVVGPSKMGVIKFDVSDLAGELITNATLRLVQTVDASAAPNRAGAQFAVTTEVYGVNSGDFDENTSTWQNYVGGVDDAALTSFLNFGTISHLGTMTNVSSPGGLSGPGGVTTFIDADLTALVQDWVDGDRPNYGLLLLTSATLTAAPASPGDVIVRYAAHESTVFDGPQLIVSHAPLVNPGDYNQDGVVDAADYVVWRDQVGQIVPVGTAADGTRDGLINHDDYEAWRQRFGEITSGMGASNATGLSVPEPGTCVMALMALVCAVNLCKSARHDCSAPNKIG